MNVKFLVTLMTCVMVVSSQSTISAEDFVQCGDLKSEIESIRQLLMTQQQEIRDAVIQLQNPPRRVCPPGFDYLPEAGSCYRVAFERMTWDNATERCRQVMPGVHLAAITSKDENDAVVKYLQSQFNGNNNNCVNSRWNSGNLIWIGGQTRNLRRCSDPYVWKPLRGIEILFNYTNWGEGDPDCHQSEEHCAQIVIGRDYIWNDADCSLLSCALCELHA